MHDFARVAGFHQLDAFLELCVREAVRDERRNIEASVNHSRDLLIHFAPVNPLDVARAENDRVPIDGTAARHRDVRARRY